MLRRSFVQTCATMTLSIFGLKPKKELRFATQGNIKYYFDENNEVYLHEYANGTKSWYQCGKLHRDDGPAIEHSNGDKAWYQNGLFHRIDGPALEWSDGTKFWYQNGKPHRDDGPAVEYPNGSKFWYKNGIKQTPVEKVKNA
jgi:hypothetical protein